MNFNRPSRKPQSTPRREDWRLWLLSQTQYIDVKSATVVFRSRRDGELDMIDCSQFYACVALRRRSDGHLNLHWCKSVAPAHENLGIRGFFEGGNCRGRCYAAAIRETAGSA